MFSIRIGRSPRQQRDAAHLRFVVKQPCLICGRQLSDAHHLRFARPRGLGLKVSDEFAVPFAGPIIARRTESALNSIGGKLSASTRCWSRAASGPKLARSENRPTPSMNNRKRFLKDGKFGRGVVVTLRKSRQAFAVSGSCTSGDRLGSIYQKRTPPDRPSEGGFLFVRTSA